MGRTVCSSCHTTFFAPSTRLAAKVLKRYAMVEVLLEFLRFGLLSIGGGFALIAEMKRVLVLERAWMTAQVFVDGWSLGQFVPGPNMLAMAFYGFQHGLACLCPALSPALSRRKSGKKSATRELP
jgi:Chromate transporter